MTQPLIDDFVHEPRVAYFSMEIALHNDIPTYAGGLGVLAGDTLRSAADLELPMVAVTLVSWSGYFRQEIDAQGRQVERPAPWDPTKLATPLDAMVAVTLEERRVWIRAWLYIVQGRPTGRQPVILLDTDLAENSDDDRRLTHFLYGGDERYRLKQEIVLGVGGVRMLQALGFSIRQYHMNEGHSAFLAAELLRRYAFPSDGLRPGESRYDIPRVRELCSFTTHTPVSAGHDRYSYELVRRTIDDFVALDVLKSLAGDDALNMTRFALNLSEYVNGVAKRHAELSQQMFPGYRVHAVTNGVHPLTWTSRSFVALYDRHLPGWCHEPELLVRAARIPDEAVMQAHQHAKTRLIEHVAAVAKTKFDPQLPILGVARRMTAYKRPELLFSDLGRLTAIHKKQPFQIVIAGKAHPRDDSGKRLIERIHAVMRELKNAVSIAFIPDYDMATALLMISGSDVWLNMPLRPMEASGTSGMKAAFNGVPSLSVLDGWWIEGCIEGVTGWAIGDNDAAHNGDDAASLYDKLENVVLPLYRQGGAAWCAVMKGAICNNASFFNSHRMMRRYATEAYIR